MSLFLIQRFPYGCSKIADIPSGSVFEQILNAMNSWSKSNADQLKLVMEACRLALVTRWPGRHHLHLKKLGIVQCHYDLLSYTSSNNGAASSTAQSDQPACLSSESSYIAGPLIIRPFVWEILGWLVIYGTVDTDFNLHGDEHEFDFLITHACQMTMNFIREWPKVVQKIARCEHEFGATFRVVLFFISSPCSYVASKAQELVSKVLLSSSWKYVAYLFGYLSPTVSARFSLMCAYLHMLIMMLWLSFWSLSIRDSYMKMNLASSWSICLKGANCKVCQIYLFTEDRNGELPFPRDCILESETNEENSWTCTLCNILKPHEHVHRIILTPGCDYLQALFKSGMEDRIVDAAVDHVAPFYPQLRDQGKLAGMSEELSNIVRARFVHISQEQWPNRWHLKNVNG